MAKPKILKQRLEYQNRYQRILRVDAQIGNHKKVFFVDDHGTRVGLIAVRNKKVLLVRQERLLTGGPCLEIPGGRAEAGESLGEAAIRECLEETGYFCSNVKALVHYMPGMDTVLNPTYIFTTGNLEKVGRPRSGPREITQPVWMPVSECVRMIETGRIRCAMTITAILMLVCQIGSRQGIAS